MIAAEFKVHPDVQAFGEEWSGITDPIVRRKLQNRLNQRAARRRKAEKKSRTPGSESTRSNSKSASPSTRDHSASGEPTKQKENVSNEEWTLVVERFSKAHNSSFVSFRDRYACNRWYPLLTSGRLLELKDFVADVRNAKDGSWMYPLPADHLISLVYYNVYRALTSNIALLGLDANMMYSDDYPSPFLPMSPTATSSIRRLPPALQPTALQQSIAHHPQWDVLPIPVIRDNILNYGEDNLDDVELCCDLVGGDLHADLTGEDMQNKNEPSGFIVWGEPWEATSWEVTESFARRWSFLLKNATILFTSTNRWRSIRGEDPLNFDEIMSLDDKIQAEIGQT